MSLLSSAGSILIAETFYAYVERCRQHLQHQFYWHQVLGILVRLSSLGLLMDQSLQTVRSEMDLLLHRGGATDPKDGIFNQFSGK